MPVIASVSPHDGVRGYSVFFLTLSAPSSVFSAALFVPFLTFLAAFLAVFFVAFHVSLAARFAEVPASFMSSLAVVWAVTTIAAAAGTSSAIANFARFVIDQT